MKKSFAKINGWDGLVSGVWRKEESWTIRCHPVTWALAPTGRVIAPLRHRRNNWLPMASRRGRKEKRGWWRIPGSAGQRGGSRVRESSTARNEDAHRDAEKEGDVYKTQGHECYYKLGISVNTYWRSTCHVIHIVRDPSPSCAPSVSETSSLSTSLLVPSLSLICDFKLGVDVGVMVLDFDLFSNLRSLDRMDVDQISVESKTKMKILVLNNWMSLKCFICEKF